MLQLRECLIKNYFGIRACLVKDIYFFVLFFFIAYFFNYKNFFYFQINFKNLDPSCKIDLDLWECLGRVNLIL